MTPQSEREVGVDAHSSDLPLALWFSMTADSTERVLCDWIERDETASSGGRICYHWRMAVGVEEHGWVKRGKLDLCPDHADTSVEAKSGKSWRQS